MTAQQPRVEATPAQRTVLWLALVVLPATKTWQIIADDSLTWTVVRQIGLALVLVIATVWVMAKGGTKLAVSRGRWLVAFGLRADPGLDDDRRWHEGRWALALVGLAAAVAATTPWGDSGLRWLLAALAAACLLGLVVVEVRRHQRWTQDVGSRASPDRHVLWTSAPLTASCVGTAVALAVAGDPSAQGAGGLAELLLVTALGEELLFRGCLLALAYRVWTPGLAQLTTALSFGAWHVGNAWRDSAGDVMGGRVAQIAGAVLVTSAGGLLFAFLRRRSHSLWGSVFAHVAVNLPGRALG